MTRIDYVDDGGCQGGIAPISCDDGDDGGGGHGDVDNDGALDTPNNNVPIIEHVVVGYDSGRQWNEGGNSQGGYDDGEDEPDPGCFLAGTPVRMADESEKLIEEIAVGDMVLAMTMPGGCNDPFAQSWLAPGEYGPARVLGLHKGGEKRYVAVNHQIRCSEDHPFLIERGGKVCFVSAKLLMLGDKLIGPLEREVTHLNLVKAAVRTFNLEVEGAHTFIANGVVVHNSYDLTIGAGAQGVKVSGSGSVGWGTFA